MIRIVRGNPTPEELAAALAVVRARAVAAASAGDPPSGHRPSAWSDPARTVPTGVPRPGPGVWRATYQPR